MNDDLAIDRLPAVLNTTGDGRSTLYNKVMAELMTEPVSLGPRAVGWPRGEVRQINQARIAGKSDDEIRALVRSLHAARRAAA
jgi:prophage regulatory protein